MTTASCLTARALGDWVRRELAAPKPDTVHITRVITQQTGQWVRDHACGGAAGQLPADVADTAPETGSREWNALIEGIVAHLCHARGLVAPEWTTRTRLEDGWAPNDVYSTDWHLLNVMQTPVELLDKGVVFARVNLERL